MRQILQSLRGVTCAPVDVPCPATGQVLIRSRASLISSGTERMLLEFADASWLERARQEPEKVRMVLEKARTEGVAATIEAVRSKLDEPIALGYCNAGIVMEIGKTDSPPFAPGDRVASNGPHAEIVSVPRNLCARIPDSVTDEAAAFTVIGAIALQGVRLAQPTLGEAFVVSGLGLIGLITVQLLRAQGCRVLGIDFDSNRIQLAQRFGADTVNLSAGEDPVAAAQRFSRGRGVDGVLITAATRSSEPVHHAALMCRKRGRIVLTGVTGLELARDDFYKKELSFQVSCSYGPGRYDPSYEQGGHDYPLPYVRWTAQRNFEAVLDLLATGRLDVETLITHRFPFDEAAAAYALIQNQTTPHLGVILQYPTETARPSPVLLNRTLQLTPAPASSVPATNAAAPTLGVIGAGAYATKMLLPAFQAAGGIRFGSIASSGGVTASHAGRKFGFEEVTTDVPGLLANPRFDSIVIATRHDSHAKLVCEALRHGKNVFVEKPLAIHASEVDDIEEAYRSAVSPSPRLLMAGFNRRFAPQVVRIHELLAASASAPKSFVMTVNAGSLPADHWTQDPAIGGGRIIGEACHFVDLLRFLAGAPIASASATRMVGGTDTATINLSFADGSIATIHYFANGHRSVPKERLEIYSQGRILSLDNFNTLRGYGWPHFRKMALWRQDKGNRACVAAFVNAVRSGGPSPIPFEQLLEVARWTIRIATTL